jgi:hypothetical protein
MFQEWYDGTEEEKVELEQLLLQMEEEEYEGFDDIEETMI